MTQTPPPTFSTERLFSGEDLLLDRLTPRMQTRNRSLVITFTQFSMSLPPKAFAGSYLARLGLPSLAFRSLKNHWWQTHEMETCLKLIDPYLDEFDDITTYGSSMGAHGALAFSAPLRAKRVVAAAPQYSISRAIVPFETRWPWEAREYPQIFDTAKWISPTAEKFIIADPGHPQDRQQVAIFSDLHPNIRHINVPYSKHSPLQELANLGILSEVVGQLLSGNHDPRQVNQIIRRATRKTLNRYTTVLNRRYPDSPRRALRKVEQAFNRLSVDPVGALNLAKLYKRCKDTDRALELALTSVRLRPNQRNIRFVDDMLCAQGRVDEVLGVLQSATQTNADRVPKILNAVRRKKDHDKRA